MGIPKFVNQLKKNPYFIGDKFNVYDPNENFTFTTNAKQYDQIHIDFHNIVYQTLILLKTEINYFIRLLINNNIHKK